MEISQFLLEYELQEDSTTLSSIKEPDLILIDEELPTSDKIQQLTPEVIPKLTPGGTKQWLPVCSNELKPTVGMSFMSVDEGIDFYRSYASVVGFNTRKSTITKRKKEKDVVAFQYCVCNKEGYKENRKGKVKQSSKDEDEGTPKSKDKISKRRLVTRVGCMARMVLKYCKDGKYIVYSFEEAHNHILYTPSCMKYQKEGRNMNILHKKMILDNAKVNIGPVRTFNQMKEFVGGYDNVGASKQDFKNFHRDLKSYIKDSDSQMFIDNFKFKKSLLDAFFFDFETDEDGQLCRVLWADPICRKNYVIFGDMVSFDTTYSTNRYNMIFGPFTGIDHHKRCVTFASCFIAKEDIDSFEWIFKTFLKAMWNSEPTCLITDQDPAMTIAITKVFKKTEHRYCMWHIMKKMPDKIGREIAQTSFLKKICACVWNVEIEPEEFESKWKEVISEFKLDKHKWLCHLYDMKKMWIPAYFRDLFLGGLMRTTSRSESENNFFTTNTNPHLTLVEFYMRFESAIDSQRHIQGHNDNESKYKRPQCKTPLGIEKHGSEIYTTSVFYEFQEEVYIGSFSCEVEELMKQNELQIFKISEENRRRKFEVVYNCSNQETTCSCKKFQRQGIACRHMIWVWKTKRLEIIPEKYVLNRWTTLATKKPILDLEGNILDQCVSTLDRKRMLNVLWSEIYSCVSLAHNDQESLCDLVQNMNALRLDLEAKKTDNNKVTTSTKINDIEMLVGATVPSEILIKAPKVSKNKGTGIHLPTTLSSTDKRLKSNKEKAIDETKKKKRFCNGCQQYCHHDLRTCRKQK